MLKLTKEQVQKGFDNGFKVESKGKFVKSNWEHTEAPRWNWDDVDYRLSDTCLTGHNLDELLSGHENGKVVFYCNEAVFDIEFAIQVMLEDPNSLNNAFMINSLIVAIDFDGTITEKPLLSGTPDEIKKGMLKCNPDLQEDCDNVIRQWHYAGIKIIINTLRVGEYAEVAMDILDASLIPYDLFNESFPEGTKEYGESKKVAADIYIDDRNLGGIPSWKEIDQLLAIHVYENMVKTK